MNTEFGGNTGAGEDDDFRKIICYFLLLDFDLKRIIKRIPIICGAETEIENIFYFKLIEIFCHSL
ncbi:hypothetical protein CVP04_04715 [Caviibacterium pharyngocola]|uniref:Uncharacterized protein n=1 Tax=Caviibacterium pharyngocola TaxID=28159 RepID=A0A2M8RX17_9PAST|nr:hypothetical protein CVP04_04715 [Caviibacterium pharyngocola]